MISKRAIEAFFRRERRDLRFYKACDAARLDSMRAKLPADPPIWNKLRLHQKVGFIAAARYRKVALFYDMGTGKTMMSIALSLYFSKLIPGLRVLILVPSRVNKDEWAREIRKHSDASFCVLRGSSKEKWAQLGETDAMFVVETYAGLVHLVSEAAPTKRGKRKLKPRKELVDRLRKTFKGLVCDESHSAKNSSTVTWRLCRALAKSAEIVFPLTGTPFGRDPQDLWAQMYLVDEGHTLGETLGLYRGAFFKAKSNGWAVEYVFEKKKQRLLHDILANRAIHYEADEADLPKVVQITRTVDLPEEAIAYYTKAKEAVRAAGGNYREMKNAFLRMRQISSGFVGFFDDDEGAKVSYEFKDNPKLELLLSIIESVVERHKVVVFHEFVYSGERIAKELRDLEIGHVTMAGRTKDTAGPLRRFDTDNDCRVMLLSNRMATGLNLQVAKYGVYYESPVSVIVRQQSRRRIERQESSHDKVFLLDCVTRGTVDELILEYQKQGVDLFQAIVKGQVRV